MEAKMILKPDLTQLETGFFNYLLNFGRIVKANNEHVPFDEFMILAIASFCQIRELDFSVVRNFDFVIDFLELFKDNTVYTFIDAVQKAGTGYLQTVN